MIEGNTVPVFSYLLYKPLYTFFCLLTWFMVRFRPCFLWMYLRTSHCMIHFGIVSSLLQHLFSSFGGSWQRFPFWLLSIILTCIHRLHRFITVLFPSQLALIGPPIGIGLFSQGDRNSFILAGWDTMLRNIPRVAPKHKQGSPWQRNRFTNSRDPCAWPNCTKPGADQHRFLSK